MELGSRVRAKRRALNLSQEGLARRADVSLNLINRLERGVITDPHYSSLSSIARALGTSVAELAGEAAPSGKAPASPSPAEERRANVAVALREVREDYRPVGEELDAYCSRWRDLLEDSAKIEDANLHEFFSIYPVFMQSLVQNLACEIADIGGALDMLDVERLDELEALSVLQPAVDRFSGLVAKVSEIAEKRDAETWGREGVTDIESARRRKLEKMAQARRGA